jgi:hypothetical protein
MSMPLDKYKEFVAGLKGRKSALEGQICTLQKHIGEIEGRIKAQSTAYDIINEVGVLAQSEVKTVIEDLVSQALRFTHGEEYSFEIENRVLRNQPETYFYVVIQGQRNSLKDEVGGSVVDVVCFALRVVFWAIQLRRTDPVLILDEPFKNGGKQQALNEMIRYLSDLLGIQFVIVTYESGAIEISDRCYHVSQRKGISTVEMLK